MFFSRLFLMCTLIGIGSFPLIYFQSEVVPEDTDNMFLGIPSPSKTRDPININTNNVTKRYDLTPLILKMDLSENVIVENDGRIVQAKLLNKESAESTVTKGVFMDDTYILKNITYFWTEDIKGVVGTTINGEGFPLKNLFIYYNRKYGTFENALKHRYGLVEMGLSVRIGSVRNKKFDRYAKILKQILEAGSEGVKTSLNTVVSWCLGDSTNSPNSTYYAYPASYLNPEKNIIYYSATAIVLTFVCEIEKTQYQETFESFKTSSGQKLTNEGKRYPRNMPVVEAKGVEIKNEI